MAFGMTPSKKIEDCNKFVENEKVLDPLYFIREGRTTMTTTSRLVG